MNIVFTTLHHIDRPKALVEYKQADGGDIQAYIEELIQMILDNQTNRRFTAVRETTEAIHAITQAIHSTDFNQFISFAETVAKRLLNIEIAAQQRYAHLTEIQKGSLIQSLVEVEDFLYYLIVKIEHRDFIDETDLVKHIGIPYEKRTQKTCLVKLENHVISDILVDDSNTRLSAYWWDDFLELQELQSNQLNTKIAFDAIDQYLAKNLKTKSPSDYTTLRNNLIGFFQTQVQFSIDDLIDNVFGDYEPDNPTVADMGKIKMTVKKMPQDKKFDSLFEIDRSVIKARKRIYKVNENVEIHLNDHIKELHNTIRSQKGDDGQMYVVIKTNNQKVFDEFYWQGETNSQ